jgi:methionyl-tRNA synthetase
VELVDTYGADAVRYYLLRNLSFASDGDFSRADFIRYYNDELANELGNLLNRVVSMISRYRGGVIPVAGPIGKLEEDLQRATAETRARAGTALERWDIGGALNTIWALVRRANQYIERSEPWHLARQAGQENQLNTVLYTAAEVTRLLAVFLAPYIPSASDSILGQLGLKPADHTVWSQQGTWGSCALTHVATGPLLFPRVEI